MRGFQKEPPDPIGLDSLAIWQRMFKAWARQFFLRSVTGGKLVPDPNGGFHLVIPNQANQSGAGNNASTPAGPAVWI